MSRNAFRAASALVILLLLVTPLAVLAHSTINVGDYALEYGWTDEPVIAGKPNNLVINLGPIGSEHDHDAETTDSTPMAEATAEEHDHDSEAAAISIIAPTDGSTVQGDQVEVTVAIEGTDEHTDTHYHLYVDDQMLIMAPFDQPTITVTNLSNGAHTIKAALASADHAEAGEPATVSISVEGSSATGDPSVAEMGSGDASEHDHDADPEFSVDVSGLKLEMVYAGQTTALTLKPAESGVAGEYVAPFTPDRAGQYTLRITGTLSGSEGDTDVNVEVQPEEATPDPNATTAAQTQTGGLDTTTVVIVVVGVLLIAAVVGAFMLTRRK